MDAEQFIKMISGTKKYKQMHDKYNLVRIGYNNQFNALDYEYQDVVASFYEDELKEMNRVLEFLNKASMNKYGVERYIIVCAPYEKEI